MLIRFQLENFLSFNDTQSFSMIASNLRNKSEHVFTKRKINLLSLSAIYGANASGKTNVIKGIDLFRFIVTKAVPSNITDKYFKEIKTNKNKATVFEVEFIKNNSVYAYGIELILNSRRIKSEWLYEIYPEKDKEEIVYERELIGDNYVVTYNEKTFIGEDKKRLDFIISDMKTNDTVLLMNEMNRNKEIKEESSLYIFEEIYNWFKNDLKIFFPNDYITKFDYVIGRNSSKDNDLDKIISSFDTGIKNVTLEKIHKDELNKFIPKDFLEDLITEIRDRQDEHKNNKNNPLESSVIRSNEVFFQLTNITNDNFDVETIKLRHGEKDTTYDFREESDGTRRLFDLLDILLNSENNKVFIVDELDRSLHPNLTYKFIELFYSVASKKNIQLLFTTHESKIMDLNLVRQDEIWFVERNNKNESKLYSLDSFKERYDKVVEKAYLEGRYGGIPVFNSFNSFVEQEEEN